MTTMTYTKSKITVKSMTLTALFMAMNIVMSSFSLPVPGGHLYLNDVVIVFASLLLSPFEAFMVGGIGAFLGDFFFYPTPMFVSLAVHGLQAVMISVISHYKEEKTWKDWVAAFVGAIIMVVGYTLGRAFVYSNLETAILKLPFQIFQASVGMIVGTLLIQRTNFREKFRKYFN